MPNGAERKAIIWEKEFEADLKRLEPDLRRQDEVLVAIEDALIHPERGIHSRRVPGMRAITTLPIGGATPLVVFYRFDDRFVYVLGVDLADV